MLTRILSIGLLVGCMPLVAVAAERPVVVELFAASSILYVRAHRWISTPFQLVFWETLLAATILLMLAFWFEGPPRIMWTKGLVFGFGYSGLIGTALGFWAMAVVNRSLPAAVTSLGILATPVVGIASSVFFLGEQIDLTLMLATTIILSGIALGTVPWRRWMRSGQAAVK